MDYRVKPDGNEGNKTHAKLRSQMKNGGRKGRRRAYRFGASAPMYQLSRKDRSFRDRLGCFSLRSALASI
jgi:hypothetical protein